MAAAGVEARAPPAAAAPELKRPAGAEAEEAPAKRTRAAALFVSAIRAVEQYPSETPKDAREMIAAGIETVMAQPLGTRDEVQRRVVDMGEEVLRDAERLAQGALATAAREAQEAEAALSTKKSGLKATEEKLAAVKKALEAASQEASDAWVALSDAQVEAKEDSASIKVISKERLALEGDRDALEAVAKDTLQPLVGGAGGAAKIEALKEYLASVDADPTLIATLGGALCRGPEARSAFDLVAVGRLEAAYEAHRAAVTQKIESKAHEEQCAKNGELGARAVIRVARRRSEAAKAAEQSAKDALDEAQLERDTADAELRSQWEVISACALGQEQATKRVAALGEALAAAQAVESQPAAAGA